MNKLDGWKEILETSKQSKVVTFYRKEVEDIIELVEAAKKLLDAKTALSTNTAKPRLRLAVKPFTEEEE